MRLAALIFFVSTVMAAQAKAAIAETAVEALPFDKCEYRQVVATLQSSMLDKQTKAANDALAVVDEQEVLVKKAPLRNVPLAKQLSVEDLDKLSRLTQRLSTLQMIQLMDSRRARDLRVLLMWAQQIDTFRRWGTSPKEGNEDFKIWGFYAAARDLMAHQLHVTAPTDDKCSIQTSISRLENESILKLNTLGPDVERNISALKAVTEKYKTRPIDPKRLSPNDRKVYERVRQLLDETDKAKAVVLDYETLKVLATASELMYEWDRSDVTDTGGDIKAVGRSVNAFIKGKDRSDPLVIAVSVWRALNDQIPADIVKQFENLEKRQPDTTEK